MIICALVAAFVLQEPHITTLVDGEAILELRSVVLSMCDAGELIAAITSPKLQKTAAAHLSAQAEESTD